MEYTDHPSKPKQGLPGTPADHPSKPKQGLPGTPEEPRQPQAVQSKAELEEEARKIRRLQTVMNMVMSEIAMSSDMTVELASEMAANMRRYALSLFPGKELAWDLIYKPRLQRLMNERFRLQ